MPADHEALLPCPFCGGQAEIIEAEEAGDAAYAVQCQTRGCESSSAVMFALKEPVEEQLTEKWNRRTPTPPQPANGEVADDVKYITAALSWYDGTEASADVREAWTRLRAALAKLEPSDGR